MYVLQAAATAKFKELGDVLEVFTHAGGLKADAALKAFVIAPTIRLSKDE